MTTELQRHQSTYFLPFNRGQGYGKPIWEAVNHGKGNPLNPNGLMTAYLWQEVLTKESISGIVEKYARIIQDKDSKTGRKEAAPARLPPLSSTGCRAQAAAQMPKHKARGSATSSNIRLVPAKATPSPGWRINWWS